MGRPDSRMQSRASKKLNFDFKKERRAVLFVVVASIIAADSVIMLCSTNEAKSFVGNILRPMTAAFAMAFSVKVVYRQKLDGLLGKAYASLAIGLVLWFTAEMIWGYYGIILRIQLPFPTLADAFWLAGYGPLAYHLFTTARLHRAFSNELTKVFAVIMAVAIFSAIYIFQILTSTDLSEPGGMLSLAISIAYPLADAVMIIPALLSITKSGKGELTAIPWIFVSWIFTAIADAIFGYTADTNIAAQISIWNLFYNAAYIFMAAGLYWHDKFFVIDEAKMERMWRNRNR
jgi:hypothetical protein